MPLFFSLLIASVFMVLFTKSPPRDFPGGQVSKTLSSQCRGPGIQSLVRVLHVITKTQHSEISKYIFFLKERNIRLLLD